MGVTWVGAGGKKGDPSNKERKLICTKYILCIFKQLNKTN